MFSILSLLCCSLILSVAPHVSEVKAETCSIVVNSVDGNDVINNKIYVTEEGFWSIRSKQENLINYMDYTINPTSTMEVVFEDFFDVIHCIEHLASQATKTLDISIIVDEIFVGGVSEEILDDAVNWSKADNAYVRDDNFEKWEYGLLQKDGATTLNKNFFVSLYVSIEDIDRYGEFQIKVFESSVREIRLVFKAYDEDAFDIFTDFRNNSYFYGESSHIKVDDYHGEYFNIGIISYDSSISFIKDDELINTLYLDNFHGGLAIGGACIRGLVNHVNVSFDEAYIKALFNEYNQSRPVFGVSTTIIGKGNPEGFIVNKDDIRVNGAHSDERVFGGLTVNNELVHGTRFIIKGIIKTKNTGEVSIGKAGKVELQIAQDSSRFIKFYIYRYVNKGTDYNNSFYVQASNSVTNENIPLTKMKDNCFPLGAGSERYFATHYELIYDDGLIYLFFNDELYFSYDSGWGIVSYCFGMTEYADVIFSHTQFIKDELLINKRIEHLNPFNEDHSFGLSSLTSHGDLNTFKQDGSRFFVKHLSDYNNAFIYDENDNPVAGNEYYLKGHLYLENHVSFGQSEILIEYASGKAYRFVLEFLSNGYYQVFTEKKEGLFYTDWAEVVKQDVGNQNNINFEVLIFDHTLYFVVNGFIRFTYDNIFTGASHIGIGGKGGIVKVNNLYSELSRSSLEDIKNSLKPYVPVSPYENRIQSYEKKYEDYEDGGLLLLGSSSLDYWSTYERDLEGINLPIYNCGIGGTDVMDWLPYMMERLVYKHSPSKIVIFLGGNGLARYSVSEICNQIKELVDTIHTRLPSAFLYMLEQKPAIRSNKTLTQYKQLNKYQKLLAEQNPEYMSLVTNWDNYYREDGVIERSYFVDDGMHLTEEGYKIWTKNVRKGLGLD